MTGYDKLLFKVLRGLSDANISFDDLRGLLLRLGFVERINGSHHVFVRDDLDGLLNLQEYKGKAKAYQVRQVRAFIKKHKLGGTSKCFDTKS